jgi:hypothetical protein
MHIGIERRAASGKVGYFFAAVFFRRSTHRFFIICDNRIALSVLKGHTSKYGRFGGVRLCLQPHRGKGYSVHYNNIRLSSAIGYITPKDMLAVYQQEIQADRDRKVEAAKEQRKNPRQRAA